MVILSVVPFSAGSADLSEDARQLVASVAEVMKTLSARSPERPTRVALVEVQGHASADEQRPKSSRRPARMRCGTPSCKPGSRPRS